MCTAHICLWVTRMYRCICVCVHLEAQVNVTGLLLHVNILGLLLQVSTLFFELRDQSSPTD